MSEHLVLVGRDEMVEGRSRSPEAADEEARQGRKGRNVEALLEKNTTLAMVISKNKDQAWP